MYSTIYRSSRLEVFCKKGFLKNLTKFTGKHLCQSFFSNRYFPVNFAKFVRTSFYRTFLVAASESGKSKLNAHKDALDQIFSIGWVFQAMISNFLTFPKAFLVFFMFFQPYSGLKDESKILKYWTWSNATSQVSGSFRSNFYKIELLLQKWITYHIYNIIWAR